MTLTMSDRNRRILASCLGMLLLIMLLLLASLNSSIEVEHRPEISMREVKVYSPPPDTPPSPMKQQGAPGSPMPSLVIANVEDPVKLDIMDLEVNMDGIVISGLGTGGPGGDGGDGGDGLGKGWGGRDGWGTVSLPELDGIPMVISAPLLDFPKEALDRNMLEYKIKLHVVIDEEGRTYPISILENPFPSMNKKILEFASGVRFTPPTKQGVPVKAEYLWPVVFSSK